MRNIKLTLEYDGADFIGWQRQKSGRSVQGELETAISKLIQEKVNVIGAGRTDSGVHARGQVANFRCESQLNTNQIKQALAALLPDDICIRDAVEVPLEFHARFSAKSRIYTYTITTQRTALLRKYSWFVKYNLDLNLLNQCAAIINESKDYEMFCSSNSSVRHYLCSVYRSMWIANGQYLHYEIEANRFLHNMVRLLVGSMVDVSRGFLKLEDFKLNFLKVKVKNVGQAAPADGLVLESVKY